MQSCSTTPKLKLIIRSCTASSIDRRPAIAGSLAAAAASKPLATVRAHVLGQSSGSTHTLFRSLLPRVQPGTSQGALHLGSAARPLPL